MAALDPAQQRGHPSSVSADQSKLDHINTYGELPEFYVDRAFSCCDCGKRAADQKWYFEEAKGHIDAKAIRCHECRKRRKGEPAKSKKELAR